MSERMNIKRLLAMVLALTMALGSLGALAEEPEWTDSLAGPEWAEPEWAEPMLGAEWTEQPQEPLAETEWTEQPQEPLTEAEWTEQPQEQQPEAHFSAVIEVTASQTEAFAGEGITLSLVGLESANMAYIIRWQWTDAQAWAVSDDERVWEDLGETGASYWFTLSEENANWGYRAELTGENGEKISSAMVSISLKWPEPEPVVEEAVVVEPEEEPAETEPEVEAEPVEVKEPEVVETEPEVEAEPVEVEEPEVVETEPEAEADPIEVKDPEVVETEPEAEAEPVAVEEPEVVETESEAEAEPVAVEEPEVVETEPEAEAELAEVEELEVVETELEAEAEPVEVEELEVVETELEAEAEPVEVEEPEVVETEPEAEAEPVEVEELTETETEPEAEEQPVEAEGPETEDNEPEVAEEAIEETEIEDASEPEETVADEKAEAEQKEEETEETPAEEEEEKEVKETSAEEEAKEEEEIELPAILTEEEMLEQNFLQATVIREGGANLYAAMDETAEAIAKVETGKLFWLKVVDGTWAQAQVIMDEKTTLTGYILLKDVAAYLSEALEEEQPLRTIIVTSTLDDLPYVSTGTEVVLTAQLDGFLEDDLYTVQWQYTPDGGETVVDAENGNELTYAYAVDKTNFAYAWRVVVTLETSEEAQADIAE